MVTHRIRRSRQLGVLVVVMTGIWITCVTKLSPENIWVEMGVVTCLGMAIYLGMSWLTRGKKWGLIASLGVVGILLMNRWQILDGVSLGLWIVVLGVISLVN